MRKYIYFVGKQELSTIKIHEQIKFWPFIVSESIKLPIYLHIIFEISSSRYWFLNLLFNASVAYKNPVLNRQKIKFKNLVQKSSLKIKLKNQVQKSSSKIKLKINFKNQLQKSTSKINFKNQVQINRGKVSKYYDFTASWKCFEAFRKTSDSKQPSDLDRHGVDLN